MAVTLEEIQRLAADREWETIVQLAASQEWPEEPESVPVFLGMVWALQWTHPQGDQFAAAMSYCEKAYRSSPTLDLIATIQLSEAALRAEVGDAVTALTILRSEPLCSSSVYRWHVAQNEAMCLRQLREWTEAMAAFDVAIAIAAASSSRYWQSRMDRALTLIEAGDLDAARDEWDTIRPPEAFLGMYHLLGVEVASASDDPVETLCRGVVALQQLTMSSRSQNGMAISEYRARVHLAMARAHMALGESTKALRQCKSIGELGPMGCPPVILRQAEQLGRIILERKETNPYAYQNGMAAHAVVH